MRIAGSYQYPTMESVIYGKPAAEALRTLQPPGRRSRSEVDRSGVGAPDRDASEVLAAFVAELGLPRRLAEVGVGEDRFDRQERDAVNFHSREPPTDPRAR
jgi:hypothetical protein